MSYKTLTASAVYALALAGVTSIGVVSSSTTAQAAPKIPCKTAKLIVPWKAGGGTHVLFSIYEKTIAEMGLTPKLKVVTVPGQGGNKGAKEAAKAKPDGCTLFAIHQSAFTSHLNGRIDFHYDRFDLFMLPFRPLNFNFIYCTFDGSLFGKSSSYYKIHI